MDENILLVGLGSIGTRHLKNLIALGFKRISVVTRLGETKKGFEQCKFYKNIDDACSKQNFTIAIIATPTSNHIDDLFKILQNKILRIYLEKPISHSLKHIEKVKRKLELSGAYLVVGYDLHFEPGLLLMKEYIDAKKIGKVVSFISEVGQYLPDWRPGTDYRKSMSAHKSKGGGVMLDLVHEFDYINWLFGPIKSIRGKNGKISNLGIDTEDVSVNIIETTSGALGTLHLDYLQCELSRKCKVIGDKGVIIWDYSKSVVKFMSHEDRIWVMHDFSKNKRNDRFINIMETFLASSKGNSDSRLVNFHDAVKSIELVEFAKDSDIDDRMVIL